MCEIPGCFLRDLENSKQYSGRKFKQNKDELVQRIYTLFNNSVFDKKVESMKKHLLSTSSVPSTPGCCKVCRRANCVFPALEECRFRWGDETRVRERNRECMWVQLCATGCHYHRRSAEGEITESLSGQEIGLPAGSETCSGSCRMVSAENNCDGGEGMC